MPTCPCRLCELTKAVNAQDLGATGASKDLSASLIILNSVIYSVNIFLIEGICSVF